MKVTDFNQVKNEFIEQLETSEWTITDFVGEDIASLLLTNVYMMNDVAKGFGQDIPDTLSIISSEKRISVILPAGMSFMVADDAICGYEDLQTDCNNILIMVQAVIDRILSRA